MSYINKSQELVISKFLQRYDYDGVLDILIECGIESGDLYYLLKSCKYATNFDFKTALKLTNNLSEQMLERKEIKNLITNLENLNKGEPEDILSELIENIKIQIVNEEYIDFLGRLYRLKEALFKYIFVNTKEGKRYTVSMHGNMVSKKNILYTLKKKYNIYNGNLIHGVTQYIKRYLKQTKRMDRVLEILNSEKLENLIRLRNESPVGHGFRGVSKEDIEKIYGSPMEVVYDLIKACELLDLGINTKKYEHINDIVIELLSKYVEHGGDGEFERKC
ncbi:MULTISPECIES: hypothetical protein [Paraclostridium]|uniref:Uncharacterized protein n=2 Tax=Paraclostridium bifermentans TaxID=1490 RepID=A0A5P3XH86_PARBF|nr:MULTISPECIES: hypothetical protein [Paraclostridium]MCU9809642.1 hypothetical protein [Paraclostridium sp. AKS46]MDV8112536.1 hypothetical protein [Bacillus sp. BAU-SS-2023]EQK48242.1 hypothetical protein C671_0457 [[Clostridium] bifermentans ATCC 19299] [Paraclostridium bifermentans ATCC 19299]MBN8048572.1 hypothetical protein [Paraclostridium bifermentans]MBZ6005787.1 hypothetical protein [Paraclostridium bifermentans]